MTNVEENNIIQYVPFMSFVHPSFWHTLTEIKLDVDKLNETTKQVFGRFNYRDDISAIFEIDGTSFNSSPQCDNFYENVTGTIMNKNTIEEFKDIDKAALLNSVGEVVWANIKNKNWIEKPNSLLNFFILSFADLKKFNYYYWFAFPSPSQPTVYLREKTQISSQFNPREMENIIVGHKALEPTQKCFFYVTKGTEISVKPLAKILTATDVVQSNFGEDLSRVYFGFVDPSNGENPGWPLRLFIAALLQHSPSFKGTDIKMLGLRYKLGGIDSSCIYTLKVPLDIKSSEESGWVGWERNDRGNFGPRLANMSESMDPMKIADASSDLNIKLMKWRLVPDLDITVMKDTKCLLLGSGTLGCHVARDLLAWGFRHITFLDSGKVSYSNPTRQVLFNFEDCLGGGKMKAEAAAENLKRILPTVITRGIALHIPMPGHPVGEALKAETLSNIDKLTAAIAEHDVVFLLLDSREARWLPTLIASHYGKIVINAALGFDSYLVMRHGVSGAGAGEGGASAHCVRGSQLGCYFCNDVTAPGNSLKDRTLDQQCTVTRPGAATIAGALAVELLVGLLQHPLRLEAPALTNRRDDQETPEEMQGVLGAVPHSIRGFLHSYQTITPTCCKFDQCIACSDSVVKKYRDEGTSFILKVCESGKYLEEVTGLRELHLAAEISDILTFSDEEDED